MMKRVILMAVCCVTGMCMVGCGGGDDGDSASGSSSIDGNIAIFWPSETAAAISAATVGSITVSIGDSGATATTDSTGYFIISGLESAEYTLRITFRGFTATYHTHVGENQRTTLNNIRVVGSTVTVDNVTVSSNSAFTGSGTAQDMAGRWTGTASYSGPGQDFNAAMTVVLTANGDSVSGSWAMGDKGGSISGTPVNGQVAFSLPNADPGHPDCANFSVRATITLSGSSLYFRASGNFCDDYCSYDVIGTDGHTMTINEYCGSYGSVIATLTK